MAKKQFDYNQAIELGITMDNEGEVYSKEGALAKNYAKKYKKGNFDFTKAQKGINNLVVTPFARKYGNDFGMKVPNDVRNAVAKNRLRNIMRRIRTGEF